MIIKMVIIICVLLSSISKSNQIQFSKCKSGKQPSIYALESNPPDISIELCKSEECGFKFREAFITFNTKYYGCIINDKEKIKSFKIGKVKRSDNFETMKNSFKKLNSDGKFSVSNEYDTEFKLKESITLDNYEILIVRCGKDNEEKFKFQEIPYKNYPQVKFSDNRFNTVEAKKKNFEIIPYYNYQCMSQCGDFVDIESTKNSKILKTQGKTENFQYIYFAYQSKKLDFVQINCSSTYASIKITIVPTFSISGNIFDESTKDYERLSYDKYDVGEQITCKANITKPTPQHREKVKLMQPHIVVFGQYGTMKLNHKNKFAYTVGEYFSGHVVICYYGLRWLIGSSLDILRTKIEVKAQLTNRALRINGKEVPTNLYRLTYTMYSKMRCWAQYMILFSANGYILPRGDMTEYPSFEFVKAFEQDEEVILEKYIAYSTNTKKLYVTCVRSYNSENMVDWNRVFKYRKYLASYLKSAIRKYSIPIEIQIRQNDKMKYDTMEWLNIFPPWKQPIYFPGDVIACHDKSKTEQPDVNLDDVAQYVNPDIYETEKLETYLTWQAIRYIRFKDLLSDRTFNMHCVISDDMVKPLILSGMVKCFARETVSQDQKYFLTGKDIVLCHKDFQVGKIRTKNYKLPQITLLKIDNESFVGSDKGIEIPVYNHKRNHSYCCPYTAEFDFKRKDLQLEYKCSQYTHINVVNYLHTEIEPLRDIEENTTVSCYLCFLRDLNTCITNKYFRKFTRIKLSMRSPNGKITISKWQNSLKLPKPDKRSGGTRYTHSDYEYKIGCEAGSPMKINWKRIYVGSCASLSPTLYIYPKYKTLFMIGQRLTCGTKSTECINSTNKIRLYKNSKIIDENLNGIKLDNNHTGPDIRVVCVMGNSGNEFDEKHIRVEGKPTNVRITPNLTTAVYGNYFKCQDDGFPPSEITWIQEDSRISLRVVEKYLIITPYDNSGNYTIKCVASNKHGYQENTLTFTVFNPFTSNSALTYENDYHNLILSLSLIAFLIIIAFGKLLVMQEHYWGQAVLFERSVVHVSLKPEDFKPTQKKPMSSMKKELPTVSIMKRTERSNKDAAETLETNSPKENASASDADTSGASAVVETSQINIKKDSLYATKASVMFKTSKANISKESSNAPTVSLLFKKSKSSASKESLNAPEASIMFKTSKSNISKESLNTPEASIMLKNSKSNTSKESLKAPESSILFKKSKSNMSKQSLSAPKASLMAKKSKSNMSKQSVNAPKTSLMAKLSKSNISKESLNAP